MARITCICGNSMSNSASPEIEYLVFNEKEWANLIDKSEMQKGAVLNSGLPRIHFWKCPNCSRLAIFESDKDQPLQWFRPEITNSNNW